MGATYKFSYKPGYPALENDPDMVQKMKKTMARVVPETMIREPESTMGAEDFSFILEKVKGCFFLLGTGDDTGVPLHNPRFTLDESLMLTGVETLVRAGLDLLGSPD
jgi:amidohydrolase